VEFNPIQQRYVEAIGHALFAFQLIEEHLKERIAISYGYVALSVSDILPFKYEYADVQDASLERLLTIFAKFSENDELLKDLRRLPTNRNYCAHQGLLHALDDGDDAATSHEAEIARIAAIAEDAWQCFVRLNRETLGLVQEINRVRPAGGA
jgi:hypothetical protein